MINVDIHSSTSYVTLQNNKTTSRRVGVATGLTNQEVVEVADFTIEWYGNTALAKLPEDTRLTFLATFLNTEK